MDIQSTIEHYLNRIEVSDENTPEALRELAYDNYAQIACHCLLDNAKVSAIEEGFNIKAMIDDVNALTQDYIQSRVPDHVLKDDKRQLTTKATLVLGLFKPKEAFRIISNVIQETMMKNPCPAWVV